MGCPWGIEVAVRIEDPLFRGGGVFIALKLYELFELLFLDFFLPGLLNVRSSFFVDFSLETAIVGS